MNWLHVNFCFVKWCRLIILVGVCTPCYWYWVQYVATHYTCCTNRTMLQPHISQCTILYPKYAHVCIFVTKCCIVGFLLSARWIWLLKLPWQTRYVGNSQDCACICNVHVMILLVPILLMEVMCCTCVYHINFLKIISLVQIVTHSAVDIPIQHFTEWACIIFMEAILTDVIVGVTLRATPGSVLLPSVIIIDGNNKIG